MKSHIEWAALLISMIVLIAGSLGCATMAATSAVYSDDDFYHEAILSDEIIALGKLDPALLKELEQPHAIAFIGKKQTYMLYKGGEELEQVSRLKLDPKRFDTNLNGGGQLYRKDDQVWGEILLSYKLSYKTTSNDEHAELTKAGFVAQQGAYDMLYEKKVYVEGIIYKAVQIPPEQLSKLSSPRPIHFFNPRDAKPPVLGKILKTPLVVIGVAADVILVPVYIGVGVLVLIGGVGSLH
jgi:hypothetical protein